MSKPNRIARTGFAALLAGLGAITGVPSTARGAEPQVTIEPGTELGDGPQDITVRGSGFDPEANGGVGIYVVFGPRTPAPTYHDDALLYIAARWVHPGAGAGSEGQAPLEPDGAFTVTMTVEPEFVDGHGTEVDCFVVECVLITMAAHGVDDRTQDTFTTITFSHDGAPAASAGQLPQVSAPPMSAQPSSEPTAETTSESGLLGGWTIPLVIGIGAVAAVASFLASRRRPKRDTSAPPD